MGRPLWLRALRGAGLIVIVAWSVFPIVVLIAASFRPASTLFDVPPELFFKPVMENYEILARQWPEFFSDLGNSMIIAGTATIVTVFSSTLAGWVYSRFRSKLLTGSAFLLIFIRMFPPIVITLPLFPVVNALGLNDTHFILIVLYTAFYVSLGTVIMQTFIDQIPRELEQAASIDGATWWQGFRYLILPLSGPGAVAVSVFILVFSWNEFLFAFIFTTDHAKTAPLIISEMLGSVTGTDWGALFAAATIQLVPVLVFVVLVQRFLIAGLSAGGVKG